VLPDRCCPCLHRSCNTGTLASNAFPRCPTSILEPQAVAQVSRRRPVTDLTALEHRLLGFEDRNNTTASPFNWRYTKADFNAYLERLTIHEPLTPAA